MWRNKPKMDENIIKNNELSKNMKKHNQRNDQNAQKSMKTPIK